MPKPPVQRDAGMRAVMEAHPETVAVFLRRGMHCPGCVKASFTTLAEAAASHGLDPEALVADLRAVVPFNAAGEPS